MNETNVQISLVQFKFWRGTSEDDTLPGLQ